MVDLKVTLDTDFTMLQSFVFSVILMLFNRHDQGVGGKIVVNRFALMFIYYNVTTKIEDR